MSDLVYLVAGDVVVLGGLIGYVLVLARRLRARRRTESRIAARWAGAARDGRGEEPVA